MENADNNDTMSHDLATTKYPVVIEGRVIELEETPQTLHSHGRFRRFSSKAEPPNCGNVFMCKMLFGIGPLRFVVAI